MGRGCKRAAARPGPALPCLLIIAQAELAQPCQVYAKPFFIACLLLTRGEQALGDGRICLNSEPVRAENRLTSGRFSNPVLLFTGILTTASP